jgi:hypothetical protein
VSSVVYFYVWGIGASTCHQDIRRRLKLIVQILDDILTPERPLNGSCVHPSLYVQIHSLCTNPFSMYKSILYVQIHSLCTNPFSNDLVPKNQLAAVRRARWIVLRLPSLYRRWLIWPSSDRKTCFAAHTVLRALSMLWGCNNADIEKPPGRRQSAIAVVAPVDRLAVTIQKLWSKQCVPGISNSWLGWTL